MRIVNMLPSSRFVTIAGSIFLSAGFVYGAYAYTHTEPTSSELAATTQTNTGADWKKALEDIQAQNPLNQLPQAPSKWSVESLLNAATSENVTDTVARRLFINLSSAKAQGLGSDIPTQDALVTEAMSRINLDRGTPAYTNNDLTISEDTKEAQKKYGNAFMEIVLDHPSANMDRTFVAVGIAVDNRDSSALEDLRLIEAAYRALTQDLVHLPVPKTFAPFHLSVVNNLDRMADTYADMRALLSDPLRGLGGFKLYETLADETGRMFTSIAQTLSKNGILFNKDEPGYTWNSFIP